jgi:hypothetical protein
VERNDGPRTSICSVILATVSIWIQLYVHKVPINFIWSHYIYLPCDSAGTEQEIFISLLVTVIPYSLPLLVSNGNVFGKHE